jgi:hypothetical protein
LDVVAGYRRTGDRGARHLEEERRREQVLSLRFFLPGKEVKDETAVPAA